MSGAHQGLAAADGGKRESEAERDEQDIENGPASEPPRCHGRSERLGWCRRLNATVSRPQMTVRSRIPTPIHTLRAIVSRPISRPMRKRIHKIQSLPGQQRGKVFRHDVARELPLANGTDDNGGHVVPDNDAGQGPEEQAFNERGGSGKPSRRGRRMLSRLD